ncbi:MAG: pyridoxal 5'-phosphate synthase lyase subunit PdxS, partial [Thermoplasmata archaeon]
RKFSVPFVCGCRNLGEAVRRIWEGAAMIRTKGEAGTGNVIEAVRHQRMVTGAVAKLKELNEDGLRKLAINYAQSYVNAALAFYPDQQIEEDTPVFYEYTYKDVVEGILSILKEIRKIQRLPVVNFAAGGIATPADAALMMMLGSDGVFVGSGIFKSENPAKRAKAIVEAVTYYDDPAVIAENSKGLGEAMKGIEISELTEEKRLQERGW